MIDDAVFTDESGLGYLRTLRKRVRELAYRVGVPASIVLTSAHEEIGNLGMLLIKARQRAGERKAMSDLSDRARSWADWLTGSGVEPRGAALLFECATELEAKDAEIAAAHAICTDARCGTGSLTERLRLLAADSMASDELRHRLCAKDAEIARLQADLAALREAVGLWPRIPHTTGMYRCVSWTGALCNCGADAANTALAAARKLAGLGE